MKLLDATDAFKSKVENIPSAQGRIDYLESYLDKNKDIPLPLLATIYESLGESYVKKGELNGAFFAKAGELWETAAVKNEQETDNNKFQRKAFKKALLNYNIASKYLEKKGEIPKALKLKEQADNLRIELKSYNGPIKTMTLIAVLVAFIASFSFLSSTTGFVIGSENVETNTFLGVIFALVGFFGAFLLIKWWR